jgi:tRNA (guanine-N7-)-methyltransferase
MTDNKPEFIRRIRSFVKREGRLTPGQASAIEKGWPIFGLNPTEPINPNTIFGNENPITLEIGFGNGESLVEMAKYSPETNFIGIEVHRPGVGRLLRLILDNKIENLFIFNVDAIEVLQQAIPNHCLDCIQLFFPDPWHKKRHHKRRIVQPNFLNLVYSKLKPGGYFHAATDWENYAEHIRRVLNAHEGFTLAPETDYDARLQLRPSTKFEERGLRLGHGVWDVVFRSTP